MQNNDFIFESALRRRLNSNPSLGEADYGDTYSGLIPTSSTSIQQATPVVSSNGSADKLVLGKDQRIPGYLEKIGIGTPEMMGVGAGLQILGQYLDAPYKEMAAKQSMEEQRKDRQSAALMNLQNISKLYGNL